MPDPYEIDDEGRPVAESRAEEQSEADAEAAAEAEPTAEGGFTAEVEPTAETTPTAEDEFTAEAEPTAESDLVAGTEPVAESAPPADPSAEEAAVRRQIETTLRFMRLQTAVGFIVIVALIIFMSDIRNVLVLVLIIFTFSSLGAYWWLARNLNSRLSRAAPRR